MDEIKKGPQSVPKSPEIDQGAVLNRLLLWLRASGRLAHRELVEILGLEKTEIAHTHPDTGVLEMKEPKASLAKDTIASRHAVQEKPRESSLCEDLPPMNRADLDSMLKLGCGFCGRSPAPAAEPHEHEVLALHARCHPRSPTWTFYAGDGILVVRCAKCDRMIAAILVAEAPRQ